MDPLADVFVDQSPYSFQRNNPISLIDPTGMAPEGFGDKKQENPLGLVNNEEEDDRPNWQKAKDNWKPGDGMMGRAEAGGGTGKGGDFNAFTNNTLAPSTGDSGGFWTFSWSSLVSGIPVVGPALSSGQKLEAGNYVGAAADFAAGVVEMFTFGLGSIGNTATKTVSTATRGLTSADGFLMRGFNVKTPFNIPVQRFGNMSVGRPDFWGPRIGTNNFLNRTFAAIKPAWNPLTQYTKGVIPKGTTIKIGIIGPQGVKYPGGSIQFIAPSNKVFNQSSKFIKR